jgi:hydroxyacylglutathione hydrolase
MIIVAEDVDTSISKLDVGGTTWPNSYLITCKQTGESALVDIPGKFELIYDQIKDSPLKYVLLTHNHKDYEPALARLKSTKQSIICGKKEDFEKYLITLDRELKSDDKIVLGKLEIKAMYTPGHTAGSMCFLVGNYLFSGDTLLKGGPGYTATPNDFERIIRSLTEKIFVLPDNTAIYPGHGNGTVLSREKNQFTVFSARPHTGLCGSIDWQS